MFIIRTATFIIKWFAEPQRSLLVLIPNMWILNLCIKLIANPTYCSLHLKHVIKLITLPLSHWKLPLMEYVLLYT